MLAGAAGHETIEDHTPQSELPQDVEHRSEMRDVQPGRYEYGRYTKAVLLDGEHRAQALLPANRAAKAIVNLRQVGMKRNLDVPQARISQPPQPVRREEDAIRGENERNVEFSDGPDQALSDPPEEAVRRPRGPKLRHSTALRSRRNPDTVSAVVARNGSG